jgi:hypothetical protein
MSRLDKETVNKLIKERAYELYLERGGAAGGDLDDWLAAERELLSSQERPEPPEADGSSEETKTPAANREARSKTARSGR